VSIEHGSERRMGKSASVQRGHVPVLVGEAGKEEEELRRVLVHRKVLQHPYFAGLLELAAAEFGHDQKGVLRIPCDVRRFHGVVQLIRRSRTRRRKKVTVPCLVFLKLL
jgi:SAUR family protein